MTFRMLLKRLQKQHYPSVRAMAAALEVKPSQLSRAMGVRGQPFDVRGCLRLARATGADPGEVLRAAGKADIADLVEQLFGTAPPLLTPEQQDVLTALAAIGDPAVRQSIITLARAAAGVAGPGQAGGDQGPVGGTLIPPPKEPDYKMRDFRARRTGTAR